MVANTVLEWLNTLEAREDFMKSVSSFWESSVNVKAQSRSASPVEFT
jgi:hypothetical protein